MTIEITEQHNVSWAMMPHNNNRTAWRPFGLPMILVEPHRRDAAGNPLSSSNVESVRIAIENVPREALVAGHDHVGLRFPDRELYVQEVSTLELYDRQINPSAQNFFKSDGTSVDFADAETGDLMQVATISGVRDTITYLRSANYYDLSDIPIETEQLAPDYYTISYQADYYVRIISQTDSNELLCIDSSRLATAVFRFTINHPGEIMEESTRLTPAVYLDAQSTKATDPSLGFYRPFADALQDVFDEQGLLESINWVDRIPPQFIPYLAFLLGFDIPFFPESLDSLRRTMLRNLVRLQQLKGSKRALVEMFELFGYTVYLINLYWAKDGSRLIRPGESLPEAYEDQEITIEQQTQIEPLLSDYDTDGFGEIEVPLLYRPATSETREGIATVIEDGPIVVDSYLVQKDSAAYIELLDVVESMNANPSGYGEEVGTLPIITGAGITGYSQVTVEGRAGLGTDETLAGIQPPFTMKGVKFDRKQNIVTLTCNGAILFSQPNQLESVTGPGYALFSFATYPKQNKIVPDDLQNLRSNRFDIQLLTKAGEPVPSDVLDFLIDFLFKLKAFHSLLNVIIYSVDLNEAYNVTDICAGGDFFYRFDTQMGQLQVPPAKIPDSPDGDGCYGDPGDLGYDENDILLRSRLRELLDENFEAWKILDERAGQEQDGDTRVEPVAGTAGRTCQFTPYGQDRIIVGYETEHTEIEYGPGPNANSSSISTQTHLRESPITQVDAGSWVTGGADASTPGDSGGYGSFVREYSTPPAQHCDLDGFTDYCYKGRVDDEVLHRSSLFYSESFRSRACNIDIGVGLYYIYPAIDRAGGRPSLDSIQSSYLLTTGVLPPSHNNWLGRLLRAYDTPDDYTLHFTNRRYSDKQTEDPAHYLALQRPEHDVQLPYLHFPGTRLASMGLMVSDFDHPTYRAKPHDDLYSTRCGPDHLQCGGGPTYLDAVLVQNANGDYMAVYTDEPFRASGNGFYPDIPSLGDHTLGTSSGFTEDDVIHSINIGQYDGHPAIALEHVGPCGSTNNGEGTYIGAGVLSVTEPLFSSAGECDTGSYRDYCPGYAYELGYQSLGDLDSDRGGVQSGFWTEAGIPTEDNPTDLQILFLLISGVRDGTMGYRLDCGCEIVSCGSDATHPDGPIILDCNASLFADQEGDSDYESDQTEIIARAVLDETIGVHNYILDGEIPSLFELSSP